MSKSVPRRSKFQIYLNLVIFDLKFDLNNPQNVKFSQANFKGTNLIKFKTKLIHLII